MNLGQAVTESEIDVLNTLLDIHDAMPVSAQHEILDTAMVMQTVLPDLSISEIIALIGLSMAIEYATRAGLTFTGASE